MIITYKCSMNNTLWTDITIRTGCHLTIPINSINSFLSQSFSILTLYNQVQMFDRSQSLMNNLEPSKNQNVSAMIIGNTGQN